MQVVRALLAYKADPNLALTNDGRTAVYIAAQRGYKDILQLLVVKGHADVNKPRANGVTPVRIAQRKGHAAIVDLLLRHGAKVEERVEEENTCLFM